ncbi:barstar family protein [Gordonia sp. PDNC005]|uniref:barstar family protein n=1 Tax=unclassified Gordonia (in: high G+C Gram-positive bacteria) TaxID=2657482 RepID=UPI00196421F7|nr:barstar family protein [Gordonia sp. PDNC005]QRY62794.1 barstar family protein [Gordonia sp. PDNC005]
MSIDEFVRTGVVGVTPAVPSLFGTGVVARRVDATDISTVDDLLDAFALAWDFPDHFGFNRDALDDCMRDLPIDLRTPEGTASTGYLTVVGHGDRLLAAEADALEWFAESVEFWHEHHRAHGRSFAVLLVSDAPDTVRDRWSGTGVSIVAVSGRD